MEADCQVFRAGYAGGKPLLGQGSVPSFSRLRSATASEDRYSLKGTVWDYWLTDSAGEAQLGEEGFGALAV